MQSNIAVTNKHTAKLHHVGSLYILTYDAWKLKHESPIYCFGWLYQLYLLYYYYYYYFIRSAIWEPKNENVQNS